MTVNYTALFDVCTRNRKKCYKAKTILKIFQMIILYIKKSYKNQANIDILKYYFA